MLHSIFQREPISSSTFSRTWQTVTPHYILWTILEIISKPRHYLAIFYSLKECHNKNSYPSSNASLRNLLPTKTEERTCLNTSTAFIKMQLTNVLKKEKRNTIFQNNNQTHIIRLLPLKDTGVQARKLIHLPTSNLMDPLRKSRHTMLPWKITEINYRSNGPKDLRTRNMYLDRIWLKALSMMTLKWATQLPTPHPGPPCSGVINGMPQTRLLQRFPIPKIIKTHLYVSPLSIR